MSKVKKKTDVFTKSNKPTSADVNGKVKTKKKKQKKKYIYIKPAPKDQEKAKPKQNAPPTDPQQLSANWKMLQEILKATQPEKKPQPALKPKHQNGLSPKKVKETGKSVIKSNAGGAGQKDTRKKTELPPVSEENSKLPGVSADRHPTAPKRKQDAGKVNGGLPAKKKKSAPEPTKPKEDDFWFDDVDPDDVEATVGSEAAEMMRKKHGLVKTPDVESLLVKERAFDGITNVVAIDCEMVGIGADGEDSMLARVSLVNKFGKCIYDKYVKPTEEVTDYRTAVSGIRPEDIKDGEDVRTVQKEVGDILKGRIVVGHAIHNDLKILLLDHPKKKIRDTQKYKPFKKLVNRGRPSLKVLCKEILNVKVQQGEHSSVQDAQATMRLYTMVKKEWEAALKANQKSRDPRVSGKRKFKSPGHKRKTPVG